MKNYKNLIFRIKGICGNRKGFALLIIMGFSLIVGVIAIAMISQSIKTMKINSNKTQASKVYYAAQAGVEKAKLRLKELKTNNLADTHGTESIDVGGQVVNVVWDIKVSTNKGDGDYFYVPNPGEGNAWGDCKSYENDDKEMDHPCSWNKIYVGETVNIPLWFYGMDTGTTYGTADGIIDPAEDYPVSGGDKLENFYLRMRTPCVDGGEDATCERYEFYGDNDIYNTSIESNINKTIVNWEIIGQNLVDESQIYNLQANLAYNGYRTNSYVDCVYSEIFQELIDLSNYTTPEYCFLLNNANLSLKNIVLSTFHSGHLNNNSVLNDTISNYLLNLSTWSSNNLHKPVLKLQVIDELRLQENQQDTSLLKDQAIPYLEYQVMTNRPIGNARRIIEATATFGNVQEKIVWDEAQEGAMGGFGLQN